MPVGYDIGPGAYRFEAPYRAGYRIIVGSDYWMTASGRLLRDRRQPADLCRRRSARPGRSRPRPGDLLHLIRRALRGFGCQARALAADDGDRSADNLRDRWSGKQRMGLLPSGDAAPVEGR